MLNTITEQIKLVQMATRKLTALRMVLYLLISAMPLAATAKARLHKISVPISFDKDVKADTITVGSPLTVIILTDIRNSDGELIYRAGTKARTTVLAISKPKAFRQSSVMTLEPVVLTDLKGVSHSMEFKETLDRETIKASACAVGTVLTAAGSYAGYTATGCALFAALYSGILWPVAVAGALGIGTYGLAKSSFKLAEKGKDLNIPKGKILHLILKA